MEIKTACFGTVTYNRQDLVHFSEGIIGFPRYRDYLPLPFEPDSDRMLCLQSIEEPEVSFILMNPFVLMKDYCPAVNQEVLKLLKCEDPNDLSYYVIAVIREPFTESTVNLKCPVAVNSKNRLAIQYVLENTEYTLRHPLKSFSDEEG